MTPTHNNRKYCLVICPNPATDVLAELKTIEAKKPNRIAQEKRYPGGKGIHVAMALSELGVPTILAGFWGSENGERLKESCNEYYPKLEIVGPTVNGYNRTCYTFKTTDELWKDTELLGSGLTIDETHFKELSSLVSDKVDNLSMIAICGSWPNGAAVTYTQQLIRLGNHYNVPTYIDCTGDQLKHALKANPFGVHLNRNEVTTFFDSNFEKGSSLLAQQCKTALVTDGAEGLHLVTAQEHIHAKVMIAHVISSVGSGDCLLAGAMASHYRNYTKTDTARLAVACGAANCIKPELGMIDKKDVDLIYDHAIVVEK